MIVVTGGAGFIGSNIVKALNQIGYNDILVVDNLKKGIKYKNLLDLNISDYMDKEEFIAKIISENYFSIDTVFHEGACSSTTEWNGRYIMNNNYKYSKNLMHFCIKKSVPFLYASSVSIYGKRISNFIEERKYEQPLNIYGYSKFLFDQYVRSFLPSVKSQICGFRYFNVYGPGEGHKDNMSSIVFTLNNQIITGKDPKIFLGSKHFKRDFIFISDVVDVNLWFWENGISGIFNCGSGLAVSFQDVANIVLNYHKNNHLKYILFPENLKDYYQSYTQADLTQLRAAGYSKPFKNITEGISEYLFWLNT